MNWNQSFRTAEAWTEKKWIRFAILIVLAWFGLWAGPYISACLAELFSFDPDSNLKEYLDIATISVFVLIALWYFRTYDTRQQIYQSDLFKGLDNLASDNSLQVDIGVAMLIEISKKIPSFDKTIMRAFIRRLKKIPANHPKKEPITHPDNKPHHVCDKRPDYSQFLSYAQYIIRWLIEYKKRNKNINYELNGLDLSYQEFTAGDKDILFEDFINPDNPPCNFSLYYIDPTGINFTDLVILSTPAGFYLAPGKRDKRHNEPIQSFQVNEVKTLRVLHADDPKRKDYLPD